MQAVIISIRAGQGNAGHTDRLAGTHVLVGKAGRLAEVDRVATDDVCRCTGHRGGGATVIRFAVGGVAHGQGFSRDFGRGAGHGAGQLIVGTISARQTDAADAYCLAGCHILVGKGGRGLCKGDRIAGNHTSRVARNRGSGTLVIHLGGAAVAGRDGLGGDVAGARHAGRCQHVVARIGARQGQARQRVVLARARILVVKAAHAGDRDHVCAQLVAHASRAGGGGGGVIHLGHGGGGQCGGQWRHRQVAGVDRCAAKVAPRVVVATAGYIVVAHHQFAAGAGGARGTQRKGGCAAVTVAVAVGAAGIGRLRQVVDHVAGAHVLHHRCKAAGAAVSRCAVACLHQQLLRLHDGQIACAVGNVVVACRQARSGQHTGVGACCGIGSGARNGQRAAQHAAGFAIHQAGISHTGRGHKVGVGLAEELGVVIGLHRQVGLVDGAAAVGPVQRVVTAVRATQCQATHLHGARVGCAGIGVVVYRGAGHIHRVAAHQVGAGHGVAGGGHVGGAVVGFSHAGVAHHVQSLGVHRQRAAGAG